MSMNLQERERVLAPSRSGRWWAVVEVHSQPVRSDQITPNSETELELEAFEATGYHRSKVRAGRARARLEREGKWLAEESLEAMRSGLTLRLEDLRWTTLPATGRVQ